MGYANEMDSVLLQQAPNSGNYMAALSN